MADPSSQLSAAVREWAHPISREDMVFRDILDAYSKINFRRPDPYPRPWVKPNRSTLGAGIAISVDHYKAIRAAVQN